MRYLLDTHAFIWWDDEKHFLSPTALAICQDPTHTLVLSLASVWEMQIKLQLGKLNFRIPLEQKILDQQQVNGLELLPITLKHIVGLDNLPNHHRDPFDRLLISQAIYENIPIISHDALIRTYAVDCIW